MRVTRVFSALALAALLGAAAGTVVGCAPDNGPAVVLKAATTSAGDVVVDAAGRAVYLYTRDAPGATHSSCTGSCLAAWPAVTTTSRAPQGEGLTAPVGEIPAEGGGYQVTLGGAPLYYFDGDTGAGMIKGQGIGGVWWLLSPDGQRVSSIGR
jgi:predicted lipoprotein with Yx(FWY)xxD motif